MIATADTLGKIKIVEFPNIYNMLTVLLYDNEDIKFCDFVNNQNLIVINSRYELHLWNMIDFKLKSKFDLRIIMEIKDEMRNESQGLIEQEDAGIKVKNENEENTNFCKEDENVKNIFYIEGNKIILQLTDSAKPLNNSKQKYFVLKITESDEIKLIDENSLKNFPSDKNTFIYLSENTKEMFLLNLNNNKESLQITSKIHFDDLK